MVTKADNYIWNSVGAALNAGQSVVMLMIITRLLGFVEAGVYSIAFATGNLFLLIGTYGVRYYQVSDLEEQYSFREYVAHRMCTVFIMLLVSIGYCIYNSRFGGYNIAKTWTFFAMCVLKSVDAIEDVIGGRLQQKGRLDCAGKMQTIRLLVSMTGMSCTIIIIRDLLVAIWIAVIAAVVIDIVMFYFYRDLITWETTNIDLSAIWGLMMVCLPVCASNFLSFYLTNAPKYAIDSVLNETIQAEYGFISMPVFVIQLLSLFIYQPILVDMTEDWNGRNDKSFMRHFRTIVRVLIVISGIVLVGAWLLGIPILSALYVTDLSAYKVSLMILLVGGSLLAYCSFLSAILTITRAQKIIPIAYLIAVIISVAITRRMTIRWGICGAASSYTIMLLLVSILLTIAFVRVLHRRKQ